MPSALVVSQQVALVTAAIFAGAASGDRRLFRTQSFHYQVAQAVRIALTFLGKFDNHVGEYRK